MEDCAEAVVSLQDVLEEDQQLEQTANAVLGPSDDTRCTYPKVSLRGACQGTYIDNVYRVYTHRYYQGSQVNFRKILESCWFSTAKCSLQSSSPKCSQRVVSGVVKTQAIYLLK